MLAPLTRSPVLKAAIAFLEKVWKPMLERMPRPALEERGCPARVAVEFGLRPERRRQGSTRIFY
jgi:hypothetical protein